MHQFNFTVHKIDSYNNSLYSQYTSSFTLHSQIDSYNNSPYSQYSSSFSLHSQIDSYNNSL